MSVCYSMEEEEEDEGEEERVSVDMLIEYTGCLCVII